MNTLRSLYNKNGVDPLKFEGIGVSLDYQESLQDDSPNMELDFYMVVSPYMEHLSNLQYSFMKVIVMRNVDAQEAGRLHKLTQKQTDELVSSIQKILKKYKGIDTQNEVN